MLPVHTSCSYVPIIFSLPIPPQEQPGMAPKAFPRESREIKSSSSLTPQHEHTDASISQVILHFQGFLDNLIPPSSEATIAVD